MSVAPRFTIITVCLNAMETISATAQSLAKQRFADYEWLVMDGASTDQTLQMLDKCHLSNKRVYSASDNGIYDAMNKAVSMATGDWLYFLNSGDEFEDDDVLSDVSAAIDRHRGVELFWGDMLYVAGDRKQPRRFRHISARTLIFADLNHQSTFAHRKLFAKLGTFDIEYQTSADYDWLIRVFRSGAICHYMSRTIARFAVGGMHSANPQALLAERQRLRLQYVSPMKLRIGLIFSRIRRRFSLVIGHGG